MFFLQIEECVVCSDKKASVLFKPCGHMCACESKFPEILNISARMIYAVSICEEASFMIIYVPFLTFRLWITHEEMCAM